MGRPKRIASNNSTKTPAETPAEPPVKDKAEAPKEEPVKNSEENGHEEEDSKDDIEEEEGPSSPKQKKLANGTKKSAGKAAPAPKTRGRNNSIAPAIEHAKKYFEEHKDGCEIICSELLKNYENKHPCYNYFSNKLKEIYGGKLTIKREKGGRNHTLIYNMKE